MSDTPRTDAVYPTALLEDAINQHGNFWGWHELRKMRDHARTIERELAAERAAREKAEAELKEDVGVIKVWRRRTEEAEGKVARLREALERMVSLDDGDQPALWAFADAFDEARAALKDTDG